MSGGGGQGEGTVEFRKAFKGVRLRRAARRDAWPAGDYVKRILWFVKYWDDAAGAYIEWDSRARARDVQEIDWKVVQ